MYLDSEFTDYQDAPCYSVPPQTPEQGCINGFQDLSGTATPYAPELSGNLSFDYQRPFSGSRLLFKTRLDLFATDSFITEATGDPENVNDSYQKIDARIALGAESGRWEVALVGRNLTDELTSQRRGNTPGSFTHQALSDRRRTVAVQFSLEY